MLIEIKHHYSGRVLFSHECESVREAVIEAFRSDSDLSGSDLSGLSIPVIKNIDAEILAACTRDGCKLEMQTWHDSECGTTHCRAGWAIHLAGKAGYDLEKQFGPDAAGSMIYAVSRPDKRVPNFYADDEAAMADLQDRFHRRAFRAAFLVKGNCNE